MAATRQLAAVATADGWLRCGHHDTALDQDLGVVSLSWDDPSLADWSDAATVGPAGLAFDPGGCLYHGDLETEQVQWIPWRPSDPLAMSGLPTEAVDLLARPSVPDVGDFHPVDPAATAGLAPVALALDWDQHLFVLDGHTSTIWVFDLDARQTIRRLQLDPVAVDLAATGGSVLVACADHAQSLVRLQARREPVPLEVPPPALVGVAPDAVGDRVAADGTGRIWLLYRAPDGRSWAVPVVDERTAAAIGPFVGASDIELNGDGHLVVAGPAGSDMRVFAFAAGQATAKPPLRARNYDGRGIVRTPDGRIGFWTAGGLRVAVAARLVYAGSGHVDLFQLDGQAFQRRWGRIFVDACIPEGTRIRVRS